MWNLQPKWFDLEISESAPLNAYRTKDSVTDLKNLGFNIPFDQFGTDYTFLNYLNQFPIVRIKIAKALVDSVHVTNSMRVLVDSIFIVAGDSIFTPLLGVLSCKLRLKPYIH